MTGTAPQETQNQTKVLYEYYYQKWCIKTTCIITVTQLSQENTEGDW